MMTSRLISSKSAETPCRSCTFSGLGFRSRRSRRPPPRSQPLESRKGERDSAKARGETSAIRTWAWSDLAHEEGDGCSSCDGCQDNSNSYYY
jgi:hypothetical protein